MKWSQVVALAQMRFCEARHRLKRLGTPGAILGSALLVLLFFSTISSFAISFGLGTIYFPKAEPNTIWAIWGAVVVAFLFFWLIGFINDLQRSELLSMSQMLHLPISPSQIFGLNFVGALFNLTTACFLPIFIGLASASVVVMGLKHLLLFPMIAAFMFMVTAITYQMRGWLAVLMEDQRRRRWVIVTATLGFVAVVQIPQLAGSFIGKGSRNDKREARQLVRKQRQKINSARQRLTAELSDRKLTTAEFTQEMAKLAEFRAELREPREFDALETDVERWVKAALIAIPPGWFPFGAKSVHEGRILMSFCAFGACSLLGAFSVLRSYRTTVSYYRGEFTGKRKARKPNVESVDDDGIRKPNFVERKIRWLSEPTSAIALADFRSLLRAPEAKMALLTPVLVFMVLGFSVWRSSGKFPSWAHPSMALGGYWVCLLTVSQFTMNQFGYNRDGFRAYILSPVPRRQILLGKNLSLVPIAILVLLCVLVGAQLVVPMRVTELLGTIFQAGSLFLISCMIANVASILVPIAMTAGAMRKPQMSLSDFGKQMLLIVVLPVASIPVVIPLVVSEVTEYFKLLPGVPIYLMCSVVLFGLSLVLYTYVIGPQGAFLRARETHVLDRVTRKR